MCACVTDLSGRTSAAICGTMCPHAISHLVRPLRRSLKDLRPLHIGRQMTKKEVLRVLCEYVCVCVYVVRKCVCVIVRVHACVRLCEN